MLIYEIRTETVSSDDDVVYVLNDAQDDGYEFVSAAAQPGGRTMLVFRRPKIDRPPQRVREGVATTLCGSGIPYPEAHA